MALDTFTTFTTYPNTHISIPRCPKYFVNTLMFQAEFTYESLYDVGVEQDDWNKLGGIACNPLNHRDNTAWIGWRYRRNQIEVAWYYNINGENVMCPDEDYLQIYTSGKINNDKNFKWEIFGLISFKQNRIVYGDLGFVNSVTNTIPTELTGKFRQWKSTRLQPYFGGNAKPKKLVKVNIKYLS